MAAYYTRLALTPLALVFSWQNKVSQAPPPTVFDWQYCFQDGSRLVGQMQVSSRPEPEEFYYPNPLQAKYIGTDGKTVLLEWQKEDFAVFETGKENLIIASNDNFVSNSMCLVSCPNRSCVQVTHWGIKLASEPFRPQAWSVQPVGAMESSPYQVHWLLSPFFPFVGYGFRWQTQPLQSPSPWDTSTYFPWMRPSPVSVATSDIRANANG